MRGSKISKWGLKSYDYLVKETNFVKDCYFTEDAEYEQCQNKKTDLIEKILNLEEGAKVLDNFCGTGTAAVSLAQRNYKVTGLDISGDMLKLAKKRAASRKVKVNWVNEDARNISFKNDFDAIVVLEPFGYAEDNNENIIVLKKMSRALKPGGKLLIECYDKELIIKHKREWSHEGSDWAIKFRYDMGIDKLTAKGIIPAKSGRGIRINFAMDLYSKSEWQKLLRNIGIESVKTYSLSRSPLYKNTLHSMSMFVTGIKGGN